MLRRPRSSPTAALEDHRLWILGLYASIGAIVVGILLTVNVLPRAYEFRQGDVSQTNVRAPRALTYISQVKTRAERERAAAQIAPIVEIDVNLVDQEGRGLTALLQNISAARTATGLTPEQREEQIARLGTPPLDSGQARWLVWMGDARWYEVAAESQRLRRDVMKDRISEVRIAEILRELPLRASDQLSEMERSIAVDLASRFIRPNLVVNEVATAEVRRQAQEAVVPIQVNVQDGEIVLREGQVVSADDLEKLELLGLRNPSTDWRSILAGFLLSAMSLGALALYIVTFQPALVSRERGLLLVGVLVIAAVLAAKIVLPARPLWVYVFPLPAMGMVIATLLDGRLAIIVTTITSVLIAYIAGGSLEIATMFALGGLVASAGSARVQRMHAYFGIGLLAGLVQVLVMAMFRLPDLNEDWSSAVVIVAACLVNGLLSAALSVGSFSILGRMFGIATTMHLLELANPTQPLLRRLLLEAPGTYHHSIMVGNLGERAAEEVGADPLLVRVGAYYHDIGKLERPYFFIENQADGTNIHEGLKPEASAHAIASHVVDGLHLADKFGLPTRVRDMIPQHHGTRMVSFFYQQASELSADPPDPEQFSYPGPKPQSKEAAILMLADGVEAATRASRDHSPEGIRELVERLIMQRLAEGELDECDLTLRDLQRIKAAFCTLLIGIYHPRIQYPEPPDAPAGASLPAPDAVAQPSP